VPIVQFGPNATIREAQVIWKGACDAAAGTSDVTVDFAGVERCDTSVLQVLLALRAELTAAGHRFSVCNVSAELAWRFHFAGIAADAGDASRPPTEH